MKITAYMNLQPRHILLDLATGTVSLGSSARNWNMDVYPTKEAAAAALSGAKDWDTYAVTADLSDGTVFTVRGDKDQTEGKLGWYVAGVFDNFPAAFAAAEGLGVMGRRGDIAVRPGPVNIFSTVEDWKARFDLSAARASSPVDSVNLRQIVELAADDAQALGTADPERAIWMKLNEKYAPKTGATA
jgi:hypothetical protein